jgi:lipid-A-disaccharide synthase
VRIGLVAGETSGDQLGAGLIAELQKIVPDLHCEGVAGPLMQAAGCEAWEAADALAVMGLIEPLREIPRLLRLRRMLLRRWIARPPDVFIGIDAPDFNLGLEIKLKAHGIPTVHYVSPSVWAWRQGRIRKIRKAADRVLCLLPFEKKFYDANGVAADFVGHPLAESMPVNPDAGAARRELGITTRQVLAVLPGSRRSEVTRLAEPFAATCRLLSESHDSLAFVAAMASGELRQMFQRELDRAGMGNRVLLLDGNAPQAVAAADVVLLASGTATLQTALLGRPMVVAYKVAALTYAIARTFRLLKTPWFALPNLLTPEPMVPELMQNDATPSKLAAEVSSLLNDGDRRAAILAAFTELRKTLTTDADRMAARSVLSLAKQVTPAYHGDDGA